jgi:predicted kinase
VTTTTGNEQHVSPRALTIVCGNAGTGKTTYATALAQEQAALLLDIDTVSERLVMAGLKALGRDPHDRDSPAYKDIYRHAIHETLFAIAAENLKTAPCIIVAPFTQERREPLFLESLQERFGCAVHVVYLWCAEDVRKARIVARRHPRDAGKLLDWIPYSQAGKDESPPPFLHERIDTTDRAPGA